MLRSIQAIHQKGILHRDIKPGNFLIRPSKSYPIVLIDFGLARPFLDPRNGQMIPPRDKPGFVGTRAYASINAHAGKELGRRDDLYSWFYCLLRIHKGKLPWKNEFEKPVFAPM